MKKFLAVVLVIAMLVLPVSCGVNQPADDLGNPSGAQTPSGTSVDADTSSDPILGIYDESSYTYENKFLKLGCQMDSTWSVYDAEQIAQLNDIVMDMMTDENIADKLENSGYVQPFFAQKEGGLVNVNITVENLGLLYGVLLSEREYANKSVELLAPSLENIGLTNVTAEVGTASFAGGEHTVVYVSATFQDAEFHEVIVCVKTGRYIANITAGSYFEDVTGDVLSMFYSL